MSRATIVVLTVNCCRATRKPQLWRSLTIFVVVLSVCSLTSAIGQQLFKEAQKQNAQEQKDGYHVVCINHDIAVMMNVDVVSGTGRQRKKQTKSVWRLANIVAMRQLKTAPSAKATETQLAAAEVAVHNPKELSIQDPKAVFTLRYYHECNRHGDILAGCQNRQCKTWFHLPTGGEIHAEPVELVSNHATLETVKMQKVLGHLGVWEANADHLDCVKKKFRGLVRAEGRAR